MLLLERGPAVLAAVDELWRTVRSYGTGEQGRVLIAYGASASYDTAPRLLQALAEAHPSVETATAVKSVSEIVTGLSDGSVDVGIVRCPPKLPELVTQVIRLEPQGVLLRRGHRLASRAAIGLGDLADETLLMHPRDANPGHYDALVELCRADGFEPRVALRSVTFDLAYSSVANGGAVAIVGESSRVGLPSELCWLPLSPPAALEVSLVARRYNRSPVVDRILEAGPVISEDLGWI